MATERSRSRTGKAKLKGSGDKSPPSKHISPFSALNDASGNPDKDFPSILSKEGTAPDIGTVVYIHGIGNKPVASVLKCQWDTALFGAAMGDRTRMAYWVDRNRYPRPEEGSCADGDKLLDAAAGMDMQALADVGVEPEVELDAAASKLMAALEARLRGDEKLPGGLDAKALPLPEGMRLWITRRITKLFLKDVQDFFFDADKRKLMEQSLRERLDAGGGPFIVIGHSQGSMIAYHVLRQLQKADCDVRLFVTIGSPLGIQEVQDALGKMDPGKPLAVPECVDRWLNVAERLDPVALDAHLENDYQANSRGVKAKDDARLMINPDWQTNPHSGTGYLSIDTVRLAVRETAGPSFSNPVGRNVLMKDLVADIEDGHREQRHPTLIQLVSEGSDDEPLAEVRKRLESLIAQVLHHNGAKPGDGRIQVMQRFISADLTRGEIEQLRSHCNSLKIDRVWRNAVKRALLNQSTHTLQVHPANLGYGACGKGIGWAVLDTGIAAGHPHFEAFGNVVAQWDCTDNMRPLKPGDAGFATLDGNGHGTHVAATIAGGMTLPNDDNDASDITLQGMAPEARLYGFKVLKDNGRGEDAFIIKALDTIAELNERAGKLVIHGVNLSLGGGFDPSVFGCGHTPLCQELRRLWRQGVLVCLAAGNEGYAMLDSAGGSIAANMDLSIGDPANLEEAIAVGSVHKANPHTYGVSYFSSRGPTADGRMKPDLVAPGENILSARHQWPKSKSRATVRNAYVQMSGTSMATPHVSGLLAAFLSVRREFIGYPERVKALLLAHCTDLGRDPYIQGKGMPNLVRMVMNT